ncbi:hypothetical protein [Rhizobium sp. FY34]|uniref:hypothetical protein n=1 Tax=Rhizobium sp. FY34 TaxID=2562309 RepID=UPI0010C07D3C|nr:hypothetical protein [Rhizobium sp. FY34]
MSVRPLLSAILIFLPAAASAADNTARCMALGREIASTTKLIGTTQEARSFASALTQQSVEIRKMRIEMHRMGCGRSGSIVTYGTDRPDPCADFADALASMENNRQAIMAQRQEATKVIRSLGRDEAALREEMRVLQCGELDFATLPISGNASPDLTSTLDPKAKNGSIVEFKTTKDTILRDTTPVPPERPFDPSKPVRVVGPQFFPDDRDIDLANPAIAGSQPRQ